MMDKSQTSFGPIKRSGFLLLFTILCLSGSNQVEAADRGDDIILSKGKIIMRGGRGKGNIILDPGSHSSDESHSMAPMMSLMSHYNPYAFYPMHSHHQPQHHQPTMMIHPIYMEDHSAMQHHHQPQEHHEQHHEQHHQQPHDQHHEQHHEQHQYHHEEPQHHYEHHDMGHHQEHYEPQQHEPLHHQHYDHEGTEHQDHGGQEEQHHHGAYEHQDHHQHPLMAMMMHGSGPQPAYQQINAMQAIQQHPSLYSPLDQQVAALQAQMAASAAAAGANQDQQQASLQTQSTNEVSQSSGAGSTKVETSTRAPNKAIALLEKTAANNPLVQIIKPLFKRNKEQKDSANQQKKS